jgi:hypothetical protein
VTATILVVDDELDVEAMVLQKFPSRPRLAREDSGTFLLPARTGLSRPLVVWLKSFSGLFDLFETEQ